MAANLLCALEGRLPANFRMTSSVGRSTLRLATKYAVMDA
jgi:hypothetical protein